MLRTKNAPYVLVALLFVAALYIGGAPAPAVPLCATMALLALASSGWTKDIANDRLAWAIGIVIAVSSLQLIPLPPALLQLLSPRSADLSARALAPLREDRSLTWRALHLDPANGWAMTQYVVGILAAYVAARQVSIRGHSLTLRIGAGFATATISFLAIAHKLTGQTELYGLYAPQQAVPEMLAPLLNPNHLSAYAGVGAILWTGMALEKVVGGIAPALAMMCGAVCAASTSRGGAAGAAIGMGLLIALESLKRRKKLKNRKGAPPTGPIQAILLAALIAMVGAYVGWTALVRDHQLGGSSKLSVMVRVFQATRDHRVVGTGIGGLYAGVSNGPSSVAETTVPFVENMVLDLLLALGPLATLLALGFAAQWLWKVRPRIRRSSSEDFSVFCALASLIVHDQVDYAMWLGASGYLAAILAGIQTGHREFVTPERGEIRREDDVVRIWRQRASMVALGATFVSLAAGLATGRLTSDAERARWRVYAQGTVLDTVAMRQTLLRHPADPAITMMGASLALRARDPRALRFVNRTMELAPSWSVTHLLLAQALASRGLRSQAILELKLSAELSAGFHPTIARLLMSMRATETEIVHVIPAGSNGISLLEQLSGVARNTARAQFIDSQLLQRDPSNRYGWVRTAERSGSNGNVAQEQRAWERLIELYPTETQGCFGLADMYIRRPVTPESISAAERALERCPHHARTDADYTRRIARICTLRRDTDGMRRAIGLLLDRVGGDADQRIAVFALRGHLELELQHEGQALTAFELADSMSAPRHPYLDQVIRIAHSMGDTGRLRSACTSLREEGELQPDVQRLCRDPESVTPRALVPTPVP